nr:MBL fold metallo-hydrolase RNA specificity domain-containing protein [Marinobacter oulmenensis]
MDDKKLAIRARAEMIGGYSAHADQCGLVEFVTEMKEKPKDIRLVHREQHARQALKEKLKVLGEAEFSGQNQTPILDKT